MEPGPISSLVDFPETQSETTLHTYRQNREDPDRIPTLFSDDSRELVADNSEEESKQNYFNNPINIEDNETSALLEQDQSRD
tara:strand:+ start:1083 stop:1328 length:246 start_codon:yes stop_codon:yes gene_type:complete